MAKRHHSQRDSAPDDATPCDEHRATVDERTARNSRRSRPLGDGKRPGATQSVGGPSGTRTQDQRIMSPLL